MGALKAPRSLAEDLVPRSPAGPWESRGDAPQAPEVAPGGGEGSGRGLICMPLTCCPPERATPVPSVPPLPPPSRRTRGPQPFPGAGGARGARGRAATHLPRTRTVAGLGWGPPGGQEGTAGRWDGGEAGRAARGAGRGRKEAGPRAPAGQEVWRGRRGGRGSLGSWGGGGYGLSGREMPGKGTLGRLGAPGEGDWRSRGLGSPGEPGEPGGPDPRQLGLRAPGERARVGWRRGRRGRERLAGWGRQEPEGAGLGWQPGLERRGWGRGVPGPGTLLVP